MLDDAPPLPDIAPPAAVEVATPQPEDVHIAITALAPRVRRILALIEIPPVEKMTPAQRRELVELRRALDEIGTAARVRVGQIDAQFKMAAEALGARELLVDGAKPVTYTPGRTEYRINGDALRRELERLASDGHLTREEVDKAVKVVVSYAPDNRVINGLVSKRGTIVADVVEALRERVDPAPLTGKLSYPEVER